VAIRVLFTVRDSWDTKLKDFGKNLLDLVREFCNMGFQEVGHMTDAALREEFTALVDKCSNVKTVTGRLQDVPSGSALFGSPEWRLV